MANKRDALGKGLGALIPGVDSLATSPAATAPVHNPASICEIPIDKISANPLSAQEQF